MFIAGGEALPFTDWFWWRRCLHCAPEGSTWDGRDRNGTQAAELVLQQYSAYLPFTRTAPDEIPRKEVIQPQLPLQLPCYDFVPVTGPALERCLLAVSELASGVTSSHDVTGGVYKARERIHRSVLTCGY